VWLYVLIIKSFAVYASDIYTAIALLASNRWAGEILQSDDDNAIKVPFTIGKWIFTGCIIFSFLLLAYEARKARQIIRSRDISYAFTNVMANNYYSLKSYDHFCFFSNINDSKKKKDEFAFFIFFTFKGSFLVPNHPFRCYINDLTRPDEKRMEASSSCRCSTSSHQCPYPVLLCSRPQVHYRYQQVL
jgi:hypothetical protein